MKVKPKQYTGASRALSKPLYLRNGSHSTVETFLSDDDSYGTSKSGSATKGFSFAIRVPGEFLILALVLSTSLAFTVGAILRTVIMDGTVSMQRYAPANHLDTAEQTAFHLGGQIELPTLASTDEKSMPHKPATDTQPASLLDQEDSDEMRIPAGKHILVDIKDVDSEFLESEEQLTAAMIELSRETNLPLLSYHCHSLVPSGISCAGVMSGSRITFHTWPKEGAISIDFFVSGVGSLVPAVPLIKQAFGIPSPEAERDEPTLIWSHKLRGFYQDASSPNFNPNDNPLVQDMGTDFMSRHEHDIKIELASDETDFQHVDIYEYVEPEMVASYRRSLSDDGSYESLHPEHFVPNKILFLDGVEQSSLRGEAAYHEALVHPAMLSHPHPERVAIIGGGEGATLREVLKHNTVDEVMMVEIDEELVDMCEEALPEWSDCSDISGCDADSCFDDSRASVDFKDAFGWFISNFHDDKNESDEEKFDVIIMDALDPDKFVAIVGSLYKDDSFVESLYKGLNDDGVFVIQLGQTDDLGEPALETGPERDVAHIMSALKNAGFESIHQYDEGHSKFDAPWSYLVCFKSYQSRASWYRTAPEVQIELHKRMHRTRSGKPILKYFDGPTMVSYQMPSKAMETKYCRSEDEPWECDEYIGVHPEIVSIPTSHLEAKKSLVGEFAGRGLFAAQDIPQYSYLPLEVSVKAFHVGPSTWSIVERFHDWADESSEAVPFVEGELSSFYTFTEGYGYAATLLGSTHYTIDAGIATFCNHGCNGMYNHGDDGAKDWTELNVDLDSSPSDILNKAMVYSPVIERHLRQIPSFGDFFLRDIKKGEEITCNYLSFVGDKRDWAEEVGQLRNQCLGESIGTIQAYELEH